MAVVYQLSRYAQQANRYLPAAGAYGIVKLNEVMHGKRKTDEKPKSPSSLGVKADRKLSPRRLSSGTSIMEFKYSSTRSRCW